MNSSFSPQNRSYNAAIKGLTGVLIAVCGAFAFCFFFAWGHTELPANSPAARAPAFLPRQEASLPFACVMVDVGQGDCFLLLSEGHTALIDCGTAASYEALHSVLSAMEIRHIDAFFITHLHDDHCGAAAEVLLNYSVGTLYLNPPEAPNALYEEIRSSARTQMLPDTPCLAGQHIPLGGLVLKVLSPQEKISLSNDASLVLMADYQGHRLLFTGDIESAAEAALLTQDLEAQILKIPHHGSDSSTTDAFLAACRPEYALISVGWENELGHPSQQVLDRLAQQNITVLRTDLHGHVLITLSSGELQIHTQKTP